MTPQQAQLLLPVIEAYAKGKVVQFAYYLSGVRQWEVYNETRYIELGNPHYEWRIKPEPPTPREWWACLFCNLFRSAYISGHPTTCDHCATPLTRVREVLPAEGGEGQA